MMISNLPTSDGTRVSSDAAKRRTDQDGQERMASVTPTPATRVAIIGAGCGGTALLDLLHQLRTIEMVGIMDRNPAAPGLQRARELQV
ncbi:MAG: hypothetical protein HP494_18820, partial [Nitrospira sp.]|nr:hypothetical protein [Nitrospira sp.]